MGRRPTDPLPSRGRASSANKPPPTSSAAAAARAAAVTAARPLSSHKQTSTPAPPDVYTAACLPSHPARLPRPRQLGAAAAATGSRPSISAPPSSAGASAAVRTPASGGTSDGVVMDHSPLLPPPPTQPLLDYKFELLRTIQTGIVAVAEWYNFRIPTGFWPRAGAVTRERCASWCLGGRGKCEADEVKVVQGRDGQGARLGKVGRYDKTTSWTEALPAWAASRSTS